MEKENKIDKAVKLLKEIQEEKGEEDKEIRKKIIDKLSDNESNYYLIMRNSESSMIGDFKVYGMVVDDYNTAYDMCSEIVEDDSDYWLLDKNEVEDLMFKLETNKNVMRKENENNRS